MEKSRAQALQELLMERHVLTNIANSARLSAYESAVAARDQSEQLLSQARADEIRAKEELAAKRKEDSSPHGINRARDNLTTAGKNMEDAQSAYTHPRVNVADLSSDL